MLRPDPGRVDRSEMRAAGIIESGDWECEKTPEQRKIAITQWDRRFRFTIYVISSGDAVISAPSTEELRAAPPPRQAAKAPCKYPLAAAAQHLPSGLGSINTAVRHQFPGPGLGRRQESMFQRTVMQGKVQALACVDV